MIRNFKTFLLLNAIFCFSCLTAQYSDDRNTYTIGNTKLFIKDEQKSIVYLEVDAIVDPANVNLNPAGGLSKVIFEKIGSPKQGWPVNNGKQATGSANIITHVSIEKYTNFHNVIHAIGPNFNKKTTFGEESYYNKPDQGFEKLRLCYKNALNTARKESFTSIAFPIISGGNFRGNQSKDQIAITAIRAIMSWMKENKGYYIQIHIVPGDENYYEELIRELDSQKTGMIRTSAYIFPKKVTDNQIKTVRRPDTKEKQQAPDVPREVQKPIIEKKTLNKAQASVIGTWLFGVGVGGTVSVLTMLFLYGLYLSAANK